jgi:two-component system, NtrC family, sensor histidine kinase HydH
MKKFTKKHLVGIPPWVIFGAVIVLVPIFVFWTIENIGKQKENATFMLLEKGAALIKSFEAGARTGRMHGRSFQLQNLLLETSQQQDISYIVITDIEGTIMAHSDPSKIGKIYETVVDIQKIYASQKLEWRKVKTHENATIFEVFRKFSPTRRYFRKQHDSMTNAEHAKPDLPILKNSPEIGQVIFLGLDMSRVEAARIEDVRRTILMAIILLLIGFAGIVTLFLSQAYRTTKSSLAKIKVFSETVIKNMPFGLIATDENGKIAYFNQEAESILHISNQRVMGKNPGQVLPEKFWAYSRDLTENESEIERDISFSLDGERTVSLEFNVSSLKGDSGEFLGDIVLFRDLTEINNLKMEIEKNQRLASLGNLAAGVAHEIRNPLSSIKGFATYFKERYKDIPDDKKTAEIMVQEVERLNRVISQLLEFASPVKIHKKSVSMVTLIQHSLKMIEGHAREKNIEIKTDLDHHTKDLYIDPDKINQVFLNIYLNAIEAMENNGTLYVRLTEDKKNNMAKVEISDTGKGIIKEDLTHIFDPYFTTKQSGTGLGLAIVHKIIESHKGDIRVESERGAGTTVTILLPVSNYV